MTNEGRNESNYEGRGRALIGDTIPTTVYSDWAKSQKLRSGWQINRQRFKTGNPNTSNRVFPS